MNLNDVLVGMGKDILAKVQERLNNKVDKQEGYGLSQNNFSTAEKEKLASLNQGVSKNYIDEQINPLSLEITEARINKTGINYNTLSNRLIDIDTKIEIKTEVIQLTQKEYDDLAAAGQLKENTLYAIV